MSQPWPYLDIQVAINDCQRNLDDVIRYAETLLDGEAHQIALKVLRYRAQCLKASLGQMLSREIAACIREEQAAYDEEESKWQAHQANNYLP